MQATLTNNITGERVKVHATTEHASCSYGQAVWVDDDNNAYLQVGTESLQPFYTISDIDSSDLRSFRAKKSQNRADSARI